MVLMHYLDWETEYQRKSAEWFIIYCNINGYVVQKFLFDDKNHGMSSHNWSGQR